jgi:hypothetical protein
LNVPGGGTESSGENTVVKPHTEQVRIGSVLEAGRMGDRNPMERHSVQIRYPVTGSGGVFSGRTLWQT